MLMMMMPFWILDTAIPTNVYDSYRFHSSFFWFGLILTAVLLLTFAATIVYIACREADRFTITTLQQ